MYVVPVLGQRDHECRIVTSGSTGGPSYVPPGIGVRDTDTTSRHRLRWLHLDLYAHPDVCPSQETPQDPNAFTVMLHTRLLHWNRLQYLRRPDGPIQPLPHPSPPSTHYRHVGTRFRNEVQDPTRELP